MGERRMFTKKITESDKFLDMPSSSQMLYFHLAMNADDDGFVDNPKKVQRMCGALESDYNLLIERKFIIVFESGIIVIKHWKLHNYIQSDRYKPTEHTEERNMLSVRKDKTYSEELCENEESGADETVKEIEIIKEVVSYLNEKIGAKYRYQTQNTQKHIRARLKEKYTIEDFKTVIDKKCEEWVGTSMSKFLRPDTLFGSKFESYLNQKSSLGKKSQCESWGES